MTTHNQPTDENDYEQIRDELFIPYRPTMPKNRTADQSTVDTRSTEVDSPDNDLQSQSVY